MFLPIMTSAIVLAVVWQYFPAETAGLARFSFENLFDAIPDVAMDEGALPVACFVFGVWILAAALRFVVHLIADLISGHLRSGLQSLGLSWNRLEVPHENRISSRERARE